ncbi:MAG TPA: tetratricopeptide repeat protein, partial [Pyrinomonadaceae bacterium]|nr:tetratricopeptide repeat protein [Pyrinomonadaceae bacterium]
EQHRRIKNRSTTNPEAYKAYLQGRYYWNKFIPEYVPNAIEAFETAVSLDPNFAQAYAGIARAYRYVLGLQSIFGSAEAKEKMLRAATSALALDDSLAEAHLAIAEIKKDEWDWKIAEAEYKRAIALNPSLAEAYAGYADFLAIFERSEEAFIQIERALELDPLSSRLRCGKGKILLMARRYAEAAEFLERAIKIEPNDALAHFSLGYAFACKKMFPEAIAQYKKALTISDASPDEFLGYAYAKTGRSESAREVLNQLKDKKDASPAELAVIYVGLGEREKAFAELEKGYEMHDLQMQYLRVEEHYDDLRGEPHFQDLLRRVGLEAQPTDESPKTEKETFIVQSKTADAEIAHPTSSAEYIVTEIKRHKRGTIIFLAILALILAGAAAFYFYSISRQPTISSIAVLPFSNRSGDENLEYLSDGLSESINTKLAQIGQLKVIAQSSAFRYKNKEIDPKEIGQALGVEALLTGSITKSGEILSITVELVNTKDGTVIWNEKYNLGAPDATADAQLVQNRIAVQTVKNLNLNLTEVQDKQLTKYATQNANAYQLYLNAALLKRKGNTLDLHRKAVDFYNQAIALDPEFALAYASLANSYRVIHSYEARPNSETRREIEEKMYQAIRRARELDPMLPEVYITLGGIKMNELDLQASEQAYHRALELNPNSPAAHSGYVNYLTNTGRFDEALTHVRLAQQLDPLNLNLKIVEGRTLFVARRFDEAIRLLQNLAKTAPENPLVHFYLAESYLLKGMTAESLAEHEKIRETEGERPTPFYIFALAKAGKTEAAREQLEMLRQSGDYAPAEFALAYIALGEKEQAFALLEKAYQERDPQLQFLKIDPFYDEIRNDSRFQDLLRRVGLD